MRKRIMKTLAMLGLSVCILVGGAVSGVAEEPARKECKENEHKWKTFVEYREDCVPTDFTLDGKTFTLCPHCGKEGRKDPVQRLTKVKNTFSNFSNLEIYEGSLQDGPKIMTVAFYYQTCMNKVVCTKCGKVKSNTVVTDARVMDSDVTANIELPASAVQGYTLQQVHAAGSKKHKIIKIHLACVMIFLHHPVWHSGCSSDDLKPLKALLTLHFFLAPHNLDLCENDFHLM